MPGKVFQTCKFSASLGVVLALGALPVSADEPNGTAAEAGVVVEVGPGGGSVVPTATATAPIGGVTTTSTSDSAVTNGNGGPVPSGTGTTPPGRTPAAIEVDVDAEAGATAGDSGASAAAGTAAAVAAPEPGAVGSATSTHAGSDSGDGSEAEHDDERTDLPATPIDTPTPGAEVEVRADTETAPSGDVDVADAAAAAAAAGAAGGATGPAPMTSHDAATATSSTTNGIDAVASGGPDGAVDAPPPGETDPAPPPGVNESTTEVEAEVTVRSDAASASAAAAGGSAASQAPYGSDSSTTVATATSVDGGLTEVFGEDRSAGATTPASAIGHQLEAEAEATQAGRTSAAAASAAGAGAGADVITSTSSSGHGAAAAAAAAPNVDVSTSVTGTVARTAAAAENPDCDGAAAAVAVVFAEELIELEAESATACRIELVVELSYAPDGTVQVDVTEQTDDPGIAPTTTLVDAEESAEAEAEAATVDGSAAAAASTAAAGLGSVTSSHVSAYAPLPDVVTLDPARLLDTRPNSSTIDGQFAGAGKVPGGQSTKVRIAGRGGVAPDAVGVELNLTAIQNEGNGFATLYSCTDTPPNASTLNYTPGTNIANAITVAPDTNGDVCIFTHDTAHFAIDVVAYMPARSDVVTLDPARLLDTRPNSSTIDGQFAGAGKVPGGQSTKVRIAGRGGVAPDAVGVELNLTAIQNEGNGFATLYSCTDTPPNASTLNYTPGTNIANAITVAPDTNGDVCIFTHDTAHFAIDVVAYMPARSDVVTLDPARLLDTRPNSSTIDGQFAGAGKVPGGQSTKVRIAGRGGVAPDAVGVELNLTAIQNEGNGFATLYSCTDTPPNASTLNYTPGTNIANATTVAPDTNGDVCIFTHDTAHFAIDVVAYVAN